MEDTNIETVQESFVWKPRLTPYEFEMTREKIEKINARAVKRGFTGKLELTYERVEETSKNEIGFEVTQVFYLASITGEAPKYNGWKFIARIDVLPNSDQFTLATAPGVETVDRSLVKPNTCEHWGSKRYRKNIYLVENEVTGEIKNVGSTCIKDFLGWNTSFSFVSVQEITDEFGGSYGRMEPSYKLESVLAAAYLAIQQWGWVPSRAEEGCPTRIHVLNIFDPPALGKNPSFAEKEYRRQLVALMGRLEEAKSKVPAMIGWIESLDNSSTFNENLKAAVSVDEVSSKQIGILAYVPEGLARSLGKIAEWEAKKMRPNEFIGKPGDKVEVSGTIEAINYFSNDFGTTTLYTILTDQGMVKWFASSKALGEDTGVPVRIKGTVKKHDTYRDVNATVLTRCKALA